MNHLLTLNRLNELIAASKGRRIAVVGDLMLDTYISGVASRLSQEAPVPVLHVRKQFSRLGGAANVIRNLKAFAPSAQITAFGVIGEDLPGRKLLGMLQEAGADVSGIVIDGTRPTIEKQRVIAGSQQVVRMDFEETTPIPDNVREQLVSKLCGMMRAGELDAIILEDYAKGLIGQDMMDRIIKVATEYGIFTSLDPHPGNRVCVKHISLMTPNRNEAFQLAGMYCTDPAEDVAEDAALMQVAAKVQETWEPDILLITLGPQGMALFSKDRQTPFIIPTIAREVFDVSGAGDTVISAFTLYNAAGADKCEAAVIANQAAGIVVGKAGTATTDPAELTASFIKHGLL